MRKVLLLGSLALPPLLAGCAPKAELMIDATKLTTTRYVERTNLETVLVSGFVIYRFAESGSISAQITYQKPQP